jgi:hypothetical protein
VDFRQLHIVRLDDPIDFITAGVIVTNAPLTVAAGAVIVHFNQCGIWLQNGAALQFEGTPSLRPVTERTAKSSQPNSLLTVSLMAPVRCRISRRSTSTPVLQSWFCLTVAA